MAYGPKPPKPPKRPERPAPKPPKPPAPKPPKRPPAPMQKTSPEDYWQDNGKKKTDDAAGKPVKGSGSRKGLDTTKWGR